MSRHRKLLRSIESTLLPLYRIERALRSTGRQVELRAVIPPRGYAAFVGTWEGMEYDGWVHLEDLTRRRYPVFEDLAWHALDKRYILDLFSKPGGAAAVPAPPGGWAHIRLTGIVERDLPAEPLLCFDEPECARALFRRFPDVALRTAESHAHISELPLVARFVIGVERVPLALLPRIETGDVLLIRSPRFEVRVGAKRLCEFQCKGQEIMLDEQLYEENEYVAESELRNEDTREEEEPQPFDISNLPVGIEFVLQEETATVAELAGYHAGMVLPLRGSTGEVTIRANGRPLGRGELIQVGEQLAVEIKTVWLTSATKHHGE